MGACDRFGFRFWFFDGFRWRHWFRFVRRLSFRRREGFRFDARLGWRYSLRHGLGVRFLFGFGCRFFIRLFRGFRRIGLGLPLRFGDWADHIERTFRKVFEFIVQDALTAI